MVVQLPGGAPISHFASLVGSVGLHAVRSYLSIIDRAAEGLLAGDPGKESIRYSSIGRQGIRLKTECSDAVEFRFFCSNCHPY